MDNPNKILAIQFKYFGDAVMMTPSLRALRESFPQAELHVLLPEKIAPVLQPLPWLDRVWAMPHRRGSATPTRTWPVIRALRREKFDRSVDFAGNDRGAIVGFLVGARQRLGWDEPGGFWGRKFCYHLRVAPPASLPHETARMARLLAAWNIQPRSLHLEIRADPAFAAAAAKLLPAGKTYCHLASSEQRKEWPLKHWAALHQMAAAAGIELVFGTGVGAREESLLREFKRLAPDATILDPISEVALYLAVLGRTRAFISGDTGPLHFAAGLGVPTLSLFGPSQPARWAPQGASHRHLSGGHCTCGNVQVCVSPSHCLAAIAPERVFAEIKDWFSTPALRPTA